MSDITGKTLSEICAMDGVSDLRPSVKCRGAFAMALKAEEEGNHEKAAQKLDQAIEAERK